MIMHMFKLKHIYFKQITTTEVAEAHFFQMEPAISNRQWERLVGEK